MYLTDIYRFFLPAAEQYTFFSLCHGTFCKIYHNLGHKSSLDKNKKIEITCCILSKHNRIKLEVSNKRNSRKYSNK
jgi:phage gp45-like